MKGRQGASWIPSSWADGVHYSALCLIVIGLPLSRFLMSVGGILLFAEWLFGGRSKQRVCTAIGDPAVLLLIAFYGLHLVGLLYTGDLEEGWNDVRIKLPLLLFPLVMGGRNAGVKREGILWVFFAAFMVASLAGILEWSGLMDFSGAPADRASPFVSPIRMSLMGCLGVAFAFLILREKGLPSWKKGALMIFILWSFFYLFILATGISMLVLFTFFLFFLASWYRRSGSWTPILLILSVLLLTASYIAWEWHDFYHPRDVPVNDIEHLEKRTAQGNPYQHDTTATLLENGYYVGLYLCEKELEKAWNARSEIPYSGRDEEGNELRFTLMRYMSSKGLKKDAEGVKRMSEEDIKNVEEGVANIVHHRMFPPRKKFRSVLFELDRYVKGFDPSGNSVGQRFEFWRAGWDIIEENPWVGVGTGDLNRAFDRAYERIDTPLREEFRLRAHQQFLSSWIAFGPLGLLLFLFSLFLPPLWKRAFRDPYYIAFFIALFLSFFTEDTLESQAGVTLFAFWNAFLLFGTKGRQERSSRF